MTKKTILWILAVVIVAGGWYLYTSKPAQEDGEVPAQQGEPAGGDAPSAGATSTAVTYNGTNFSPSSVAVKKGGTVTFTSASDMWVAANPHPSHEGYNGTTRERHCPDTLGTSFDQCERGKSYTFTFQETGSWSYHDHANPAAGGVVNVVE